jgi:hypothetical protein
MSIADQVITTSSKITENTEKHQVKSGTLASTANPTITTSIQETTS